MDINSFDYAKETYKYKFPLDKRQRKQAKDVINKFGKDNNITGAQLICRELYDFTSFKINQKSDENFGSVVIEVVMNRGDFLECYFDDEMNTVHLWVRINGEIYLYMLIPQDWCVEVSL